MRLQTAIFVLMLLLSGCHTAPMLSPAPFDLATPGFSSEQLSPQLFRVMHVGRSGQSLKRVRRELEQHVQPLCSGSYELDDVEEIIMVVAHTPAEGGYSVRAMASCHG